MMTTIPNPDGWLDAFVILAAIAMVTIPTMIAARNTKGIRKVQDQVANGHTTPLRADLDEMRNTLNAIRADVHDMRTELRDERKDRLDLNHRFENFRRSQ